MATSDEVGKVLAGAMVIFTNFKYGPGVTAAMFAAAWHRHVGHLPAAQLQAAMDRAVHGTEFFPTVSDVLKAAGQLERGEGRTALEAWERVKYAMRVYGNWNPPHPGPYPLQVVSRPWHFKDDKITAAVQGLGWANLFEGDEDVMRSHFVRAYDAMSLRDMQRALAVAGPEPVKELTP